MMEKSSIFCRSLALITALLLTAVLCACGASNKVDRKQTSEPEANASAQETAEAEGQYKISGLPGTFDVPDGYNVYSLESGFTEEMCKAQGVGYDNMERYLEMSTIDVLIVPADQPLNSAEVQFEIRVKDQKDYGIDNLASLNDEDLKSFANALVAGFGVSDYEIAEENGLRYVVFSTKIMQDQVRYATIINGKMVYVFSECNGMLPDHFAEDLHQIAMSIRN